MSDRSEAYRVSDDLVERVARAMCATHGYEPDGLTYREARAAIAVALEEAAKVCEVGDHAEVGAYINAIRALAPK